MMSVTRRIEMITQPRNGYVAADSFHQTQYEDNNSIVDLETYGAFLSSIQGMAVDYLTRYMLTRISY